MQLLSELKKVKFKLNNHNFTFDENGDFVSGYDLIIWERDGHHRRFRRIGKYTVLGQQIELDVKNVVWVSTANTTVRQHWAHSIHSQV